jgi:PmbA protein
MHSHLRGHPALIEAVKRLEQLKPDQYELYFERKTATKIDSKDQNVDSLSRAQDVGLSIRLIKDRRMGFSFTTSLEGPSIQRAVASALDVAQLMPQDDFSSLFSFGEAVYPSVDTYDERGQSVPMAQKIALAKQLEAKCRATDPRITGVRAASLSETVYETHLVDSNGEHIEHRMSLYGASISCKAEKNGDSQMGGDFGFSNFLDGLKIDEVAASAAHYATELLGAGSAPTLTCPAILRNSVVAELVEFLSSSFSAEQVDKGRSMLAGKAGTRIFSDQVTLIDDGLLAGGYATSPFDGEGIPSSRTMLVDGGFLSSFLYDTYYARKFGKRPTGNSSRGIKSPPSIGLTNLFMENGRKTPESLIAGIDRGILITDLMGVHTANPVTGDFSLGASGILIEGGKLTRAVRGFAVAGNVLGVFKQMTDVGNDLRFFGNVGAPSVRVAELSIGGS